MKRQNKRSKSQDNHISSSNDKINVTVLLSEEERIIFPVPKDCPLNALNQLLIKKVQEFKIQKVIGFESVPEDYLFDYRLSKNIGLLSENRNLTLNCLYKISTFNNILTFKQQYQNLHTTFHRLSKYKICKPLSSGGFSRVYLVRNLQNGQFYAGKFMQKCSEVNIGREQAIRNEFFLHKSLNHPYIVKMEEYIQTEEFHILIMEYCPGGQLFTLLKNNRYMGQEKAKVIFIQVLLAIKYIHDRNIVFRDIKPQNILIDSKGNAKITDFGLAKEIRGKTNSYCGSVQYMAPEIVSRKNYSFSVDLYCMGALLYEILIGCPPFYNPNYTNDETKYHICNSEVSFPRKLHLSEEVKELISSLLVKNQNQRLGHLEGVKQILQHEWIGQISIEKFLKGKINNPFVPHLDVENFDRQEDQYELSFRNKIQKDMKNGNLYLMSVMNKMKQKTHLKVKSQSIGINGQKTLKSKSQEEFKLKFSQHKKQFEPFQISNYSKKWPSQKTNPYSFSIKNKSISQILPIYRDEANFLVEQKNLFKKKIMNRTLSRSANKSTFTTGKNSFDNEKNQILNTDLISKSKSCANSRKSSLYKASIHKTNDKIVDLSQSKSKTKFQDSNHSNSIVSSKNEKTFQRKNSQQKQKQRNCFPQQTSNKQNLESKGLKRKNVLKKKFIFSSSNKDGGVIQRNNFMIQRQNMV